MQLKIYIAILKKKMGVLTIRINFKGKKLRYTFNKKNYEKLVAVAKLVIQI